MTTILVVEDNDMNLSLVQFLLEREGYTIVSVPHAEAALLQIRDQRPDLILMDIQLPGMDGLEATAILKRDESTRSIPIIALTALAMSGDESRILGAGCDAYIAKPIDYRTFLVTVSTQLAAT